MSALNFWLAQAGRQNLVAIVLFVCQSELKLYFEKAKRAVDQMIKT